MVDALGMIETKGYVAAMAAADAMVKAANVTIVGREQVGDGLAAVIINGEGTLKRWHTYSCQGKKTVSLHPANEHFDPIDITEESAKDVLVFGKYVGLVRGNLRFA